MTPAIKKLDLKKELKAFYSVAPNRIEEVTPPEASYLMIDGKGDPNTSKEYQEAIETLFSVSYPLKFAMKKSKKIDYGVMPLEGLWWTESGSFDIREKTKWSWTAMILQPEYVTKQLLDTVLEEVRKKKELPALDRLRFTRFLEGRAVQIMHTGPYSEEQSTIERMHDYIQERGYRLAGKHHEIYLNSPQRTASSKLKTILRQPVR